MASYRLNVKQVVYFLVMDSLGDILGKRHIREPDEIALAKAYIKDTFQADSFIAIKDDTLVITVSSAALAGALRMRIRHLQTACNTARRIVLRIS